MYEVTSYFNSGERHTSELEAEATGSVHFLVRFPYKRDRWLEDVAKPGDDFELRFPSRPASPLKRRQR